MRLGLVTGSPGRWHIAGGGDSIVLEGALSALRRDGAITDNGSGAELTAHGEALYGPDLRQRRWLSVT